MTDPRYPSPLGSYIATMRDADPDGAMNFGRKVWREHGVLIVQPDTLGPINKASAIGLAELLFGPRR